MRNPKSLLVDVRGSPISRGRPQDAMRADTSNSASNFSTPPPDTVNSGMGNYFEALRDSKDRSAIPYAMVHLRPQILRLLNGLNRKLLAAIARTLVDNGGVALAAVNTIANYSVPVYPQAATDNPQWNTLADDFFNNTWGKQADYTKRFTLEELQQIISIAIDTDGDIGANVTANRGMPQVRLYDTFHIGLLTGLDPRDGVIVDDKDGVLLGYNVVDGPVETVTGMALRSMPESQFLLLRDVDRYNNYRGFSPLRTGSNDYRDGNDIKAFHKLREKIWAALAAVIQANGPLEEDVWGDDTGTAGNAPAADASPSAKKLSLAELLGGDIPVINGELKQLSVQSPGVDTIQFLEFLTGCFVSGLEIPPAFFLDEKLTGPNVRAVLGKMQRKFDKRKAMIAKFVEFVWLRVIAWAITNNQLPAQANWWKIGFQFPTRITIDLGDQTANERQDTLFGQMTRQERFGNRGKNWQQQEDQITREDDYVLGQCKTLADKHKVPVEMILAKRGFGTAKPGQGTNDQQQTGNDQQGENKKQKSK
jgi:hypothetical protein